MIDGNTRIIDVIQENDKVKEILEKHGMYCSGCPGAVHGTLSEAAESHDLCLEELIAEIEETM